MSLRLTNPSGSRLEFPFQQRRLQLLLPTLQLGLGGNADVLTLITAGPVNGHRAVRLSDHESVMHASADEPANAQTVFGISLQASGFGLPVRVRRSGVERFNGWTFTTGEPVFLGLDGLLTQTPPVTGVEVQVGTAVAPDSLLVRIEPPIYL